METYIAKVSQESNDGLSSLGSILRQSSNTRVKEVGQKVRVLVQLERERETKREGEWECVRVTELVENYSIASINLFPLNTLWWETIIKGGSSRAHLAWGGWNVVLSKNLTRTWEKIHYLLIRWASRLINSRQIKLKDRTSDKPQSYAAYDVILSWHHHDVIN